MGSSGTGRLTDYANAGNVGGNQGGSSGNNKCENSITEQLEDVGACDYYLKHTDVPPAGEPVSLKFNKRLVIVDATGSEIGFLPTQYNYLVSCIGDGYAYEGTVESSTSSPLPAVLVALAASKS